MRIIPPRPCDRLKTPRLGSPPARSPYAWRAIVRRDRWTIQTFGLSCAASDRRRRSAIPRRGTSIGNQRRRMRTPSNSKPGPIELRRSHAAPWPGSTPRRWPSRAESDCVRGHRAVRPPAHAVPLGPPSETACAEAGRTALNHLLGPSAAVEAAGFRQVQVTLNRGVVEPVRNRPPGAAIV